MLVLGALVAGNGYGWGTWKTIFTQGPSRTSSGRLDADAELFVVAVVPLTLVLCFGVSVTIALTEARRWSGPPPGGCPLGAGRLPGAGDVGAGRVRLGTLARGPALAVGLGLVWTLVVENLLRGVGALLGPIESLTHVLPGTAAVRWSARCWTSAPTRTRPPACSTPWPGGRPCSPCWCTPWRCPRSSYCWCGGGTSPEVALPRSATRWENRSRCLDTARASTCSATTRSRRR